jgi:hypothetical protein
MRYWCKCKLGYKTIEFSVESGSIKEALEKGEEIAMDAICGCEGQILQSEIIEIKE